MSTRHISEEAEAARTALGQLDKAAQARAQEVQKRRNGLQTERERVTRGARLAMQNIADEDVELAEELQQLDPQQPEPEPEPQAGTGETNANGDGDEAEEGDTTPAEPEPEVPQRQTSRRYVVADSVIGAILAVVAGLIAMALLWSWATSGWVLAMPTLLWGVLRTVISAGVVYIVAYLAGSLGDVFDSRRVQWMPNGQSNG